MKTRGDDLTRPPPATERGSVQNQFTSADHEQAYRRLASVTDVPAFVERLGWLPVEIAAINQSAEMFIYGEDIDTVVAVMNGG